MRIILYAIYLSVWLIFSEKLTFEVFALGFVVVFGVLSFNKNIFTISTFKISFKSIFYVIEYIFLLLFEVLKANISVAILVLSIKPNISPVFITHHIKLKSDFLKTILANSITLTPGTIAVSLENDSLLIHCLTGTFAKDFQNSRFEKILLKIEEI